MWNCTCAAARHDFTTNIQEVAPSCSARQSAGDFAGADLVRTVERSRGFRPDTHFRRKRPRRDLGAHRGARFASEVNVLEWVCMASNSADSAICAAGSECRIFQRGSVALFAAFEAQLRFNLLEFHCNGTSLTNKPRQRSSACIGDGHGVSGLPHGEIRKVAEDVVAAPNAVDRN